MPAALRAAVQAEPGHVLVRADLGQVEPRVLAAVSEDDALAAAAQAADLYLPVAERLRCERRVAKVAVLAAMYGQTSGAAGEALTQMRRAYPAAMRFLRSADQAGRDNRSIRTYGGRLVPLSPLDPELGAEQRRAVVASRGRYIRNAMVQGAAAEFFKAWAATVRAHLGDRGRIVLCLHDELLLHVRDAHAADVITLLSDDLAATASRWFPTTAVRFVADTSAVRAWSDAKPAPPADPEKRLPPIGG
jgi:DNA polymerase-1